MDKILAVLGTAKQVIDRKAYMPYLSAGYSLHEIRLVYSHNGTQLCEVGKKLCSPEDIRLMIYGVDQGS